MATLPMVQRREQARLQAEEFDGVLSRSRLRAVGIDREALVRQIASKTWRTHGRQTVALHPSALSPDALRWRAVWEVGERIARIDGVSALQAAGLVNFSTDDVVVSIPHGCRPNRVRGVDVHQVTKRLEGEVVNVGVPRIRVPIAAIRAAHWAKSDRQAALVLCMVIQQGLASGSQLAGAAELVTGRRRRALVKQLVADISDGAHSLGELDFGGLCRARGLPEPSRQVVRRGPKGRIYLDARWDDIGLVVEIDGSQHRQGLAVMDDNLRVNSLTERGGGRAHR